MQNNRIWVVLLLLISAVGIGVRAFHLNQFGLWLDEGFTAKASQFTVPEIWNNRLETVGSLYFILIHFWCQIFGTSETSLRSFSILCGGISIFLTGLIGEALSNKRVGLSAAVIMCLMVFPLHYSREARPYSLFLMLVLLSMYYFIQFLHRQKRTDFLGYVIATVAACYTHNYTAFILFAQNLFMLLFHRNKATLLRWVALQLIVLLCFMPWLQKFLRITNKILSTGFWIPAPSFNEFLNTARTQLAFGVPHFLPWLCFLIAIAGAFLPVREKSSEEFSTLQRATFLLLWLLAPILLPLAISSFLTPIFVFRYTLCAVPALYLLLSLGIAQAPSRWIRYAASTTLLVTMLWSVYNYFGNGYSSLVKGYHGYPAERWREFVPEVMRLMRDGDGMAVSFGALPVFEYYAHVPVQGFPPTETDKPHLTWFMRHLSQGHQRLWMVWFRMPSVRSGDELIDLFSENYGRRVIRMETPPNRFTRVVRFNLTKPPNRPQPRLDVER